MDNKKQKGLTTRKMVTQFYLDMTKYLLLLLAAYGLFDPSTQGTIAKPLLLIVTLIFIISAALRAQLNMDRIDEREEKISQEDINKHEE
ncbi:MAG: hypothetical protein WC539_07445 [Nitrospirota bacterium]